MKHFIKALFWVTTRLFGILALCGLIAGITADVPGVKDTEVGGSALTFLSATLTWSLNILYEYPDGVLICLILASLVRLLVIYPHHERFKQEVQQARKKRRSSLPGQPARKKKQRRKK